MVIHNPHILILSIAMAILIAGVAFYAVVSAVIEWKKFKAGYSEVKRIRSRYFDFPSSPPGAE